MLPTINNVAGQTAYGKIRPAKQDQRQTDGRKNQAKKQQHLADVGHESILKAKGLHRWEGLYAVSAKT